MNAQVTVPKTAAHRGRYASVKWHMLGWTLVSGSALAFVGNIKPQQTQPDRAAPTLRWELQADGLATRSLPGSAVQATVNGGASYRISLRAGDDRGLADVSITGLGTFRCGSPGNGQDQSPDFIVSLPTINQAYPVTVGSPLRREALVTQPLALRRISCERFALPAGDGSDRLYARSGTVLLRARVRDLSGNSAVGNFRLTVH